MVIVKGLNEGGHVVVAGTFLVDSESRLKTVAAGMRDSKTNTPMVSAGREVILRNMPEVKRANVPVGGTLDHGCGMKIDPAKSVAEGNTLNYRGTTYFFCSKSCKDAFAKRPEQYLSVGHH